MTDDQRRAALKTANVRRAAVAELRKRVGSNRDEAVRVLLDPPEEARDLAVIEVLVLARGAKGWRSKCVQEVGARAVRDQVNVLMPLGAASERTRRWAATEGMVWAKSTHNGGVAS